MKNKTFLEVYGVIGRSFCACAGGIVGFILSGPILAVTGILLGSVVGHLLEKGILKSSF